MGSQRHRRFIHNIPAAKTLRRPMTATETLLWEHLRDRRLMGTKFRRQHAIGRFVVDFYCHELRLVVEIDGSVHDEPGRRLLDAQRQEDLEDLGLRFIRFRAEDVAADAAIVVAKLATAISSLAANVVSPSPATQESGEGAGG
jgi:very-short-patch-repair endonuclease